MASLMTTIPKTISRRTAAVVFDFARDSGRVQVITADDGVETIPLPGTSVIQPLADRIQSFLDQQYRATDAGHRRDMQSADFRRSTLDDVMRDAACLFPRKLQERLTDCRRLIIVPDERLFDVPWLAVPFGSKLLIDQFREGISVAPAFSNLTRSRPNRRAPYSRSTLFPMAEATETVLHPPAHWSRMTIAGEARFNRYVPAESYFDTRNGRVTASGLDLRSTLREAAELSGAAETGPWSHLECVLSLNGVSARTSPIGGGERSGLPWSALSRGARGLIGTLWPITPGQQQYLRQTLSEASESLPIAAAMIQAAQVMRSQSVDTFVRSIPWAALSLFGSL